MAQTEFTVTIACVGCNKDEDRIAACDRMIDADDWFKRMALVPEPENPYDSNAIRVEYDGAQVGYVSRETQAAAREVLDAMHLDWEVAGAKFDADVLKWVDFEVKGTAR